MALHMLSAITSDRNCNFIFVHIFLATLAVLVQQVAHVSSSSFLNRNTHLIAFVSHLLILSRVAQLQGQFPLPKQKTLQTCSTILLHFTLSTARLCFCKSSRLYTRTQPALLIRPCRVKGCNNPFMDTVILHNSCSVLWSRHVEGRLDFNEPAPLPCMTKRLQYDCTCF